VTSAVASSSASSTNPRLTSSPLPSAAANPSCAAADAADPGPSPAPPGPAPPGPPAAPPRPRLLDAAATLPRPAPMRPAPVPPDVGVRPREPRVAKNTAPTTAGPTADPIRCAVCSIPAAVPPPRTSTSARESAWFGVITPPLPIPATNNAGASATPIPIAVPPGPVPTVPPGVPAKCRDASSTATIPTANRLNAVSVTSRPKRCTSRPLTAAAIAEPTAYAVTDSPDCSAE